MVAIYIVAARDMKELDSYLMEHEEAREYNFLSNKKRAINGFGVLEYRTVMNLP